MSGRQPVLLERGQLDLDDGVVALGQHDELELDPHVSTWTAVPDIGDAPVVLVVVLHPVQFIRQVPVD